MTYWRLYYPCNEIQYLSHRSDFRIVLLVGILNRIVFVSDTGVVIFKRCTSQNVKHRTDKHSLKTTSPKYFRMVSHPGLQQAICAQDQIDCMVLL